MELAVDAAMAACEHARRPSLDIGCGDINMARWQKGSTQLWNDATYDIFEKRCILPVADWSDECCFVAIRESFVQQLLVKGSSWGEQFDEKSPEEKAAIWRTFLTQRGARLTSKDAHWPMQLSVRVAPAL